MAKDAIEDMSGESALGTDAAARKRRRTLRERVNALENKRLVIGVASTLFGGIFWGFSGTCASFLFENYQVDTAWLMCTRQLCSGALFLEPEIPVVHGKQGLSGPEVLPGLEPVILERSADAEGEGSLVVGTRDERVFPAIVGGEIRGGGGGPHVEHLGCRGGLSAAGREKDTAQ